jgi:hypothetical protein
MESRAGQGAAGDPPLESKVELKDISNIKGVVVGNLTGSNTVIGPISII